MANIDYLNVESFRPQLGWKPEGMLGGYLYGEQERDYLRLLSQAEESRRLAIQKQQQELQEYMHGSPGRMQNMTNEQALAQGRAPFMQQLGATEGELGVATNRSNLGMIPVKEEDARTNLSIKKSTEALRKMQTSAQLMIGAVTTAMELDKAQGPMSGAGIQYLTSRVEELRKMGYDVPEGYQDPKNWQGIYQGQVNTAAYTQEMLKQREKLESEERRTERSAQATENAARIRATTPRQQRLPRTPDEAVIYYRNIMNDPDASEDDKKTAKANLQSAVTQLWQKFESSPANMDIMSLRDRASRSQVPKDREAAAASYAAKRNSFFQQYGIEPLGFNAATPADRVRQQGVPDYSKLWKQ